MLNLTKKPFGVDNSKFYLITILAIAKNMKNNYI